MIEQFKQKSPVNIVLLIILGLLIKAPLFLFSRPVQVADTDSFFYDSLASLLVVGTDSLSASVIAFTLLFIQAFLLNYLVNEFKLTARHTYLPAMAYIIITSLLPEWNYLSAPLIANTFVVWALILLLKVYNTPSARSTIFNIGLITGLCSFVYFPSLLIAVCFLLGIIILRPFKLNELFLLLMGVLTPFYFYAVYLFLNNQLDIYTFLPSINVQVPKIKSSAWLITDAVLLVLFFLIGGYYVQVNLRKMVIQVRKNWGILFLYLLLTLLIPFINTSTSFSNWVLMAVPFAGFHAAMYYFMPRKWLAIAFFIISVGIIIIQQYATTLWQ